MIFRYLKLSFENLVAALVCVLAAIVFFIGVPLPHLAYWLDDHLIDPVRLWLMVRQGKN